MQDGKRVVREEPADVVFWDHQEAVVWCTFAAGAMACPTVQTESAEAMADELLRAWRERLPPGLRAAERAVRAEDAEALADMREAVIDPAVQAAIDAAVKAKRQADRAQLAEANAKSAAPTGDGGTGWDAGDR